ncbi:hypothetical protein HPB50_000929 [Hyalomma asiaticum]|uniref:Uncharacterized protein n=1 Tax=Hyalomma asiaticum TaxID=266040 RepID=A0ACB7RPT4_HYAAI|nr:hypothetical protein HPB50_000929 [Hyalomma asiaticum]
MTMESIEVDRSLYDIGDSDLKDLWAQESFESLQCLLFTLKLFLAGFGDAFSSPSAKVHSMASFLDAQEDGDLSHFLLLSHLSAGLLVFPGVLARAQRSSASFTCPAFSSFP